VSGRGVSIDSTWREEGKRVFELVGSFMTSVQRFGEALDLSGEVGRAEDTRTAFHAVNPAHDECYSALENWTRRCAPGTRNAGRKDPSRGGFAALSFALQDAYMTVVLTHLTVLGLGYYAGQIAADGLKESVRDAYGLASTWYDEAMTCAKSIVDTVEERGSTFNYATYSSYCDRVPPNARSAYEELQPYLNALNRRPIAGLDNVDQPAS